MDEPRLVDEELGMNDVES
jgi:hypothetical protein